MEYDKLLPLKNNLEHDDEQNKKTRYDDDEQNKKTRHDDETYFNIYFDIIKGKYSWCGCCGRNGHYKNHGYHLSLNDSAICGTGYYMINIRILMNANLYNKCDIIEMYDFKNFLIQYSVDLKSQTLRYGSLFSTKFFFPITQNHFGTKLNIQFRKYCPDIPHNQFSRMPMETIESTIITLPSPIITCNNICPYCENNVENDDNEYISNCKHKMHLSCIFSNLKYNDVTPSRVCSIDKIFDYFECPICNNHLIN